MQDKDNSIFNRKRVSVKDIVIMKLLPGTDGAKMSKSAGNYISLTANPHDMYGKVLSLSDEVMPTYFELCTYLDPSGEDKFRDKKRLAHEIVKLYHGEKLAQEAALNFEKVHQRGEYKESLLIHKTIPAGSYPIVELPVVSGATTSIVQSKELIRSGAVDINDKVLTADSWKQTIELKPSDMIRIGKNRIVKVE